MNETKSERSERLKREAAERINREYQEGTLWKGGKKKPKFISAKDRK